MALDANGATGAADQDVKTVPDPRDSLDLATDQKVDRNQ
jgi:hypothetical protein